MPESPQDKSAQPSTPFQHMEEVQYNDGETSILFRTEGDYLDLSSDTKFEYARGLDAANSPNVGLARTADGNVYGFGRGVVLNGHLHKVRVIEKDLPNITIGQPWRFGDEHDTPPIVDVELRYKNMPAGQAAVQIKRPSPFPELLQDLADARQDMGLDG